MSTPPQLALPFAHIPHYQREDFLWAASNEAARLWLARPADWPQHRLALWGDAGSGKTHLLHLWAADTAVLIDGATLNALPSSFGAIAIDDADRCPEPSVLLHLLNRCAEAGAAVLLAARPPPARWAVALPDLASRLRAMTAVAIAAPEDTLLRALLARLLAERQLLMAPDLQTWLLRHLERTAQAVREAVTRLDGAGLAAGRRLDRRLVAEVMAELSQTSCEDFMSVPESSSGAADLG